jgi:hypothetical protein
MGTRTSPVASWGPCPSGKGSGACGGTSQGKVPRPAVAGGGRGGEDTLVTKYGRQWGWVGLKGLLLVVVSGEGKLVVPVDLTVRRADPPGPRGCCRAILTWLHVLWNRTWAALQRRCRRLPPPVVIAESWYGYAGLMAHMANAQRGTLLVEGKTSSVFVWPDGRRLNGQDWLTRQDWRWRQDLHWSGCGMPDSR